MDQEPENHPGIVITGLRGGSGKTVVTLGLAAEWRKAGLGIAPFKKGPDFIDAGWLSFAAKRQCYNLDAYLMNEYQILDSFITHSKCADISLIEGNRGLYDGMDVEGTCSTAELAKILNAPVLLIMDVSMTTRTAAALVKGCQVFDPDLNLAGIILNRVAGKRQENLIRDAIKKYCHLPVVGAIPRLKENPFPERHMGLVPFQEKDHAEKAVSWARSVIKNYLQLDTIRQIIHHAGQIPTSIPALETHPIKSFSEHCLRIGYIRDNAFWFYYPENLSALEAAGATLVEISALTHKELPHLDALYIGGGFPETQAEALADNQIFRMSLKNKIEEGLPVYAECGGLMFLGESLLVEGQTCPMVGAIPIVFDLQKKPQGHGYTSLVVEKENPFYPVGEQLKGHEFHYSKPILTGKENIRFAFKVNRGHGIMDQKDGIFKKNILATYTHIHAAGTPGWTDGFIRKALVFKNKDVEIP